MAKKKMSMFVRLIYSAVGITGLGSLLWALFNWSTFLNMPDWSIAAFTVAVIGSVNWGIVAINNDRKKDLFGLLGL